MNIIDQLEQRYAETGDSLMRQASDSLHLEQLLSDKLYRSLLLSMNGPTSTQSSLIVNEAIVFYETSRLIEVLPEQ